MIDGLDVTTDPEHGEWKEMSGFGRYAELTLPKGVAAIDVTVSVSDKRPRFVSYGTEGKSSHEQNAFTQELRRREPFRVSVPVRWDKGLPGTRWEPGDNFRVINLDRNGRLLQTEIGIATRGPRVFVTIQTQFRGTILSGKEGSITVVPSQPQFAYPGFSGYAEQWSGIMPHLKWGVDRWKLRVNGRSSKMAWDPGPNPYGAAGAVVLYFSPVGGAGRLLRSNDEVLFVRLTAIKEVNDGIALSPMTWVRVLEIDDSNVPGGHRQAKRVTL